MSVATGDRLNAGGSPLYFHTTRDATSFVVAVSVRPRVVARTRGSTRVRASLPSFGLTVNVRERERQAVAAFRQFLNEGYAPLVDTVRHGRALLKELDFVPLGPSFGSADALWHPFGEALAKWIEEREQYLRSQGLL
jgi:hypothetical protein